MSNVLNVVALASTIKTEKKQSLRGTVAPLSQHQRQYSPRRACLTISWALRRAAIVRQR